MQPTMISQTEAGTKEHAHAPAPLAQRPRDMAGSLLSLQHTHGNQFVGRVLRAKSIQAKLTISESGDPAELEADRVAGQVMRMKEPGAQVVQAGAAGSQVQRMCNECEEEEAGQKVQAKAAAAAGQAEELTDETLPAVAGMHGGGQPLAQPVRSFFEPRFGYDFSHVRVHTDAGASASARALSARAYTLGHDIVFGAGEYAPHTDDGNLLLAHELTHVIQQRGSAHGKLKVESPSSDEVQAKRADAATGFGFTPPLVKQDLRVEVVSARKIQRQPTVQSGSVGCPVPELQEALNATGASLTVDGDFGAATDTAAKAFQTAHPPLASNGVVDGPTWTALHAAAPGNHGVPTGETTATHGWGTGIWATAHQWRQRLTPTNRRFDSCQVTEVDAGGGTDSCHFAGSTFAPFTALSGGTWPVGASNFWGDDTVGWKTNAVTYYRAQGRAPCGFSLNQSMRVVRSGGNVAYKANVLSAQIGVTTVSSNRDGHPVSKTWP